MSRRIIVIDQPTFGIPQNYLTKGPEHTIVQIYFKFMVDLAEILGAEREEAKTDLTDSLNFELELAKTVLASISHEKSKPLYKIMIIQELESKYPSIPWLQYINEMLAPHVQVDPSEEFILRMPGFFDAFEKLITATPKHTLSNYALWRMTSQSASFLSDRIRRLDAEFQAAISGYTRLKKPQWLGCVSDAVANLPVLVGALYVRRYFDESSKADASEIMHDIIRSFEHRVKQVDWMNDNMRTFTLEKLNKIILYIGYPNELRNDEVLNNFFESLALKPESYLKNMLNIKRFYTTNKFMNLKKPIVKNNWLHHSFITIPNAQYNYKDKNIDYPAGILQGKFFAKDRPKYLNYGAIGSVMGHELIHAFDDEERQYDKDGKLIELWDNETRQTFIERAQCVIDQYNNFTVQEINMQVEGYNTQVENIADIGGLKQAYYAYKNWQQRNGQEELLPGLSYTPNQMFWIGAANIWCSKMTKEALKDKVFNGRHSPNEFRVIGPMSNNPKFAKDFNCPLRSTMNPIKKCAVW